MDVYIVNKRAQNRKKKLYPFNEYFTHVNKYDVNNMFCEQKKYDHPYRVKKKKRIFFTIQFPQSFTTTFRQVLQFYIN